jgi:hypothetical protein
MTRASIRRWEERRSGLLLGATETILCVRFNVTFVSLSKHTKKGPSVWSAERYTSFYSAFGEPHTVSANLRGAKRLEEIGNTLGMRSVCPPLEPYSEEDTFGMSFAVCILIRSLDSGKTEGFIQFSTAQGLQSMYSNLFHASSQHQT